MRGATATIFLLALTVLLLASLAAGEPPVRGYGSYKPNNYHSTGFDTPSTSYGVPDTGIASYSPPTNNYLPPSFSGPGHNSYDSHGHGASHGHGNEEPKSYEFGYSVKDARSGNDYNRHESSDGNVVRGEYRVALPDGRTQIVTYHADWQTGYHADVRYEGEARYPEPINTHQGGYNYNAPSDFAGSLSGFSGGFRRPSTAYGPPGFH